MARQSTWKTPGPTRWMWLATADVSAGDVVALTTCCGIADQDIANTKQGLLIMDGVVTLPIATGTAIPAGTVLYWDDTNNVVVTTASGNTILGRCANHKLSAPTAIDVALGFGI